MPFKEIFSVIAIILNITSAFPYAKGIIKGNVKPHMFSWTIWTIVCGTGASIQYAEGGGVGSWMMIFNTFWCLGVSITSYWVGTKDIKKSDWFILIGALLAVPVWLITNDPLWSVFIVIGIDGFAYYPTIRKSWSQPDQESVLSWFISCLMFVFSILALERYALTTYLYPAFFVVINLAFTLMLLGRRQVLRRKSA